MPPPRSPRRGSVAASRGSAGAQVGRWIAVALLLLGLLVVGFIVPGGPGGGGPAPPPWLLVLSPPAPPAVEARPLAASPPPRLDRLPLRRRAGDAEVADRARRV